MNLDLDVFTYITGVAGLLGLALQLKDAFPEHREIRKTIVVLVFGIFLGSLISAIRGVRLDIGATLSPTQILIGVFTAVLAFVAVVAAFAREPQRRIGLFAFTGIGTVALFVLLLATGLGSVEDSRAQREREQINLEELLMLADNSIAKENYERALILLAEAKKRLPRKDERMKILEHREAEVRAQQVRGKP
jgi:hypothetical protein